MEKPLEDVKSLPPLFQAGAPKMQIELCFTRTITTPNQQTKQ
jgi:hypothetical protein